MTRWIVSCLNILDRGSSSESTLPPGHCSGLCPVQDSIGACRLQGSRHVQRSSLGSCNQGDVQSERGTAALPMMTCASIGLCGRQAEDRRQHRARPQDARRGKRKASDLLPEARTQDTNGAHVVIDNTEQGATNAFLRTWTDTQAYACRLPAHRRRDREAHRDVPVDTMPAHTSLVVESPAAGIDGKYYHCCCCHVQRLHACAMQVGMQTRGCETPQEHEVARALTTLGIPFVLHLQVCRSP